MAILPMVFRTGETPVILMGKMPMPRTDMVACAAGKLIERELVKICTFVAAVAVMIGALQCFGAEEQTKQARAVFEKNKDAVVWVTASAKFEISNGTRSGSKEAKLQAAGTIIDPCGLTVVSLPEIDPGAMADGKVQPDGSRISVKTKHGDVKIVLPPSKANPNGLEVPARIALKDPDLNLAFILPDETAKDKPAAFPFVKLEKAPKVQELDDLVCIGRMVKNLEQAPMVSMSKVASVVHKPRTFIIGGNYHGGPVFTLDGTLVGITALYSSDDGQIHTTVILPAEDVQEVAQQAKTAKPVKETPTTSKSAGTLGGPDDSTKTNGGAFVPVPATKPK
jgi:hypothetical protein